jgi:outer membrane protein OmpA-like peptidoglycan-associated protein
MRRPLLAASALALAASGCVTGGKLAAQADSVRTQTEQARKAGAMRCAPRELALADVNLDFAARELAAGNDGRAQEHLAAAEANARKAAELSRDCVQKVVVKKEPPKPPVIVKKAPVDTDGDGIPDDIDRCPLDPEDKDGFQDEDGCPDPDNDGDGIVDAMDACPNNPGPLENRGCPIMDRDGDGVPDWEDKCPDVAGPRENGGCPVEAKKYTLIDVKKDRIEIRQQVLFVRGKFAVDKKSFPLLDQVAQALKDNPKIRVRVEGHTDNVGTAKANLKLSQQRADAVRTYLVKQGIEAKRLESKGYGQTKPIASNKTEKGRTQNRRTDFVVLATTP